MKDEQTPRNDSDERTMTILEHLQELRLRLRNSMLVLLMTGVGAYVYADELFNFLARPVVRALKQLQEPPTIVKINPGEGFLVSFKLAVVFGLLIALPLILWELWKFVAPGLYRRERRVVMMLTGATAACFLGGAVFGYFLLSETTHLFLLGSGNQAALPDTDQAQVRNLLSMSTVADFQITMLLGCGVAFELPVVIGILGWMGLVNARGLWRFNRYALLLAAVAGAVVTPGGDVQTQLMLAGPLYVLYNLSIGVVWLLERREVKLDPESPLVLLLAAASAAGLRRRPVRAANWVGAVAAHRG